MAGKRTEQTLEVEGRKLKVTNLEKPMFPVAGFTKGQVLDFYIRIGPVLLPHLYQRPVTLKRYPDGVGGEFFYEKDAPGYTPDWIATFPVPRRAGGRPIRYILINDLATLVWCANLANLEIHPFLHLVPEIDRPTSLAFDLDPGEGASLIECAQVAMLIRDLFERMHLRSFSKVSGSKGLQIYVPLNTGTTYEATQRFARTVAQFLEREHPQLVISEMAKVARKNKVFIDWSQNSDFKTTVGVYSLRANRQTPFVSLPVTWDELASALRDGETSGLHFQPEAALERIERVGDLWAEILTLKQQLPEAFEPSTAPKQTPAPKALKEYRRKRDFAVTKEPTPDAEPRASRQGGRRRFVIQKHAASHLHYDFRLEMAGVLKSWAVPKGPPYKQDERRLARATEDHPLDYLEFEGTIPQGQYGGGTVMVWDIGTYELIEGNYWKGQLRLFLEGKKLKGEWLMERDPSAKDKNTWALVKAGKSMRPLSAKRDDSSAVSGRSMAEIAESRDRVWHSNRVAGTTLDKLPEAAAAFMRTDAGSLVAELPEGEGWRYELKLDGYRALAVRDKSGATLLSRRNNPLNSDFPEIAKACAALPAQTVIDGEIVALDEKGKPSFNLLQNRRSSAHSIVYYAFDALVYDGRRLTGLPLEARTEMLERALEGVPEPVRLLGSLSAPASDLVQAARQQGLEGIVAKKLKSIYEPGQRSGRLG